MVAPPFPSRTYDPRDIQLPLMAPWARALRAFAAWLGIRGTPIAVNGVLRRRVYVRRHKLWEYAASAACLFAGGEKRLRILDFGGAATLPIYFLVSRGCEVVCLDIDERLCEATQRAADRHRWALRAFPTNLLQSPLPSEAAGPFDAVISSSVLEHLPKARQPSAFERLGTLLRPGGLFVMTFDFGQDAPQPDAVRTVEEVEQLVAASGLQWMGGQAFQDTGARFVLDRRHPDRKFTFGAIFLERRT
jgi:SAM-dependent methyltransferase